MAAESYLLLSRVLLEKNHLGEAGRTLTAAREMDLESADLTYTRGVVAERSGDLAAALHGWNGVVIQRYEQVAGEWILLSTKRDFVSSKASTGSYRFGGIFALTLQRPAFDVVCGTVYGGGERSSSENFGLTGTFGQGQPIGPTASRGFTLGAGFIYCVAPAPRAPEVAPTPTPTATPTPEIGTGPVRQFTADGAFITQWGASGSAPGQLSGPTGVAVDSDGNVYVADTGNHRIQRFTADGTFITQWGASGSAPGQLSGPAGVAVDGDGNVYVADTGNHRIQRFTADGAFITQWGASGSA
ncbi:MAG: SBBP repeat-containing protein, partial [Planctomycetes bacterium]|nr:SBBP repeat-containing protein [Planctomycetota bacterium]